jgi:hypothetical protein
MLSQSLHRSLGVAAAALAAIALLSPLPAAAHHGWGGQQSEETQLTGTLETAVSTSGPHATMRILSGGQVWDVTLGPRARTEGAGLREGIIPLGATVTVHGHRSSNMSRFEIKTERVVWGNRAFEVYPDRD